MNWEQLQNIRSVSATEKAYVRFINCTERSVEVIWINYGGQYVKHFLERKGHFIDVNTYKSHPWIVLDKNTNDRLHIEKEFIYYPKTTKEFFREKFPNRAVPLNFEARIRANVTIPLYSLQFRAMLVVRNHLKTPEQVNSLEIPRLIKEKLKKSIELRNIATSVCTEGTS